MTFKRLYPSMKFLFLCLLQATPLAAQNYIAVRDNPPPVTRELRAAWVASVHNIDWPSAKGLMKNQGGISTALRKVYTQPAAVPPMPWLSKSVPAQTAASASASGSNATVRWPAPQGVSKVAVQARQSGVWHTIAIVPAGAGSISTTRAEAFAITSFDRYGNSSTPKILGLP